MARLHDAADDGRTAFRNAACAKVAPWAILMTAGALVLVTTVNALIGPPISGLSLVLNALVATAMFVVVLLGRARRWPDGAWPWLLSGSAVALVGAGQVQVYLTPDGSSFAYLLVIMVAFSPLALSWAPTLLASAVMIGGCVIVAQRWPGTEASDWTVVAITASGVGLALMWLRIRSAYALADATERVRALALIDTLTRVLNRRGLRDHASVVVGLATRLGEPVGVTFLDVRGLKSANDTYGHPAGDAILRAVGSALREVSRSADVIGRWGGDEFVVLGVGAPGSPDRLEQRIDERIGSADLDDRVRPVHVSVGTASRCLSAGPDSIADVDALIAAADADMYRRRAERAATD